MPRSHADAVTAAMRTYDGTGRDTAIVGEVCAQRAGSVILSTAIGGDRVIDMLVDEQLPRSC